MDINRVLARVDIDAVLANADLDALVARVDVQAIVDRLDLDQIVAKVDLNAVAPAGRHRRARRTDRARLADRPLRVGGRWARTIDVVRSQGVGLDSFVHRWVDRILRRDRRHEPGGPPLLLAGEAGVTTVTTTTYASIRERTGLEGHYAGVVTRFVAFVIDVVAIGVLFSLGGHVVEYMLSRAAPGAGAASPTRRRAPRIALGALGVRLLRVPAGRVRPHVRHGRPRGAGGSSRRRRPRRAPAVLRVLALPLSFLLFGLGFVLIVLRRDRRALHDLIAGTRRRLRLGRPRRPAAVPRQTLTSLTLTAGHATEIADTSIVPSSPSYGRENRRKSKPPLLALAVVSNGG